MQFVHWPLTLGFFLVLVPLLIHLINLMRQRRIEWAAMDFLLAAYKKQRKWIWLKQLLLLLARMLAVAMAVAMLARLVTNQQWLQSLGSKPIHHVILLDDSMSMSDRESATTAFDRATQAIGRLAAHLGQQTADQVGNARFTVMRFSQAARATSALQDVDTASSDTASSDEQDDKANPTADINMVPIDTNLALLWEKKRVGLTVSELAVRPDKALQMAEQLASQRPDDRMVVYLFSDYRRADWEDATELQQRVSKLEEAGAQVNFVRCVESVRPNLAITSIEPAPGTLAAGVPLFVDVAVKNFGEQAAEHVVVTFHAAFYDDRLTAQAESGEGIIGQSKVDREELPGIDIERIGPGETVHRRVQVFFPLAGNHVVEAELPADPVLADNRRRCVVELPPDVPVLVIDDDPSQRNAAYVNSVFRPGKLVETGIRPEIQAESFLRDSSVDALAAYRAIYLLDTGSLDERTLSNLEQYVKAGGGLAIFLGPQSSRDFLQRWYDEGKGLFPLAVDRMDLLEPSSEGEPDLQVENHRLFQVLSGERNTFLRSILVRQYFRAQRNWSPSPESNTQVIARLRNNEPFVVERQYGDGRVVAVMSTLSPTWNNWATGPTFVVFLLELQAYIHAPNQTPADRLVGSAVPVQVDAAQYLPEVTFTIPTDDLEERRSIEAVAKRVSEETSNVMTTRLGNGSFAEETSQAGIYEAWLRQQEGEYRVQRFALNVDPKESDLQLSLPEQLAEGLSDKVVMLTTSDVTTGAPDDRRFSLSQFLMFALIGLLVAEQLLSYSASYHPQARSGR
jgi:uncharacterized membrane protein